MRSGAGKVGRPQVARWNLELPEKQGTRQGQEGLRGQELGKGARTLLRASFELPESRSSPSVCGRPSGRFLMLFLSC